MQSLQCLQQSVVVFFTLLCTVLEDLNWYVRYVASVCYCGSALNLFKLHCLFSPTEVGNGWM